MLASAVFFYGQGRNGEATPASLFDAYDLIRDLVGQRMSIPSLYDTTFLLFPQRLPLSLLLPCFVLAKARL